MRRFFVLTVASCLLATGLVGPSAGAAVAAKADDRFLNTRTTSVGTAPALTDLIGCSTACPTPNPANAFATETVDGKNHRVLDFSSDNGLSLAPTTGVASNDTYTVVVLFRLHTLNKWNRVLEFANGTRDPGLYLNPSNALTFWPLTNGGATIVAPDQYVQVALTRDGATGTVTGYVDGVQQWQFNDSLSYAVIDSNNTLHFFQDNTSNGSLREDSAGAVARIRVYGTALSATAVAALDRAAPAPKLALSASSGSPGSALTVTGTNFGPVENVKLTFVDSVGVKTPIGSVSSNVAGGFSKSVTIPAGAASGQGRIVAAGVTSKLSAKKPFTVV
jgi:hypothetical protein